MIYLYFETPNFVFEVFADTEEEARGLLDKAWKKHVQGYVADPNYIEEFKNDIYIRKIEAGQVWRDGEWMEL